MALDDVQEPVHDLNGAFVNVNWGQIGLRCPVSFVNLDFDLEQDQKVGFVLIIEDELHVRDLERKFQRGSASELVCGNEDRRGGA